MLSTNEMNVFQFICTECIIYIGSYFYLRLSHFLNLDCVGDVIGVDVSPGCGVSSVGNAVDCAGDVV